MGGVLEIPFDVVHKHEKSFEGQQHLNENRTKFNADAWEVLVLMLQGKRLNHPQCTEDKLTLSISSRISELKKSNYKVDVSKEWFKSAEGNRVYIEYFLLPDEVKRIQELIISNLIFVKHKKQD